MNKHCLFCGSLAAKPPIHKWIEEKHYSSSVNTVKEVFIGIDNPPHNAARYGRQYTKSVFYCSLSCLEKQMDQEEKEDWAKGDCTSCGQPLVVINETHQAEAHYFPLKADCLEPPKGGNQ